MDRDHLVSNKVEKVISPYGNHGVIYYETWCHTYPYIIYHITVVISTLSVELSNLGPYLPQYLPQAQILYPSKLKKLRETLSETKYGIIMYNHNVTNKDLLIWKRYAYVCDSMLNIVQGNSLLTNEVALLAERVYYHNSLFIIANIFYIGYYSFPCMCTTIVYFISFPRWFHFVFPSPTTFSRQFNFVIWAYCNCVLKYWGN